MRLKRKIGKALDLACWAPKARPYLKKTKAGKKFNRDRIKLVDDRKHPCPYSRNKRTLT